MPIQVQCVCGSRLQAEDRFAGSRALCPYCRRTLVLPGTAAVAAAVAVPQSAAADVPAPAPPPPPPAPAASPAPPPSASASAPAKQAAPAAAPQPAPASVLDEALDVVEFLDSPPPPPPPPARSAAVAPPAPKTPWGKRMLLALLDPQAIQWLLVLGGGLMVIGLVIWLASLGIFQNPYVVAVGLGLGSLAIHAGGCATMLRTSHRIAGRALTFLACVVLPLNLWYYQYQGILTLDGQLWVAAFVICWVFIGTVYVLKDPLFVFAVEAGVTLTALLLMASLGRVSDATSLSITLLVLALVSIHGERAFPDDAAVFSRRRFGLNLFWSGHVQLAASLCFLGIAQVVHWLVKPTGDLLGITWTGTLITESKYVAGGIWLAGMYAYIYSDLVVRRIGLYTYLAALCLLMAEVTIVGLDVPVEALIALMTLTAVAVNVALAMAGPGAERMRRTLPPLSLLVSFLAVVIGMILHMRATSQVVEQMHWSYHTGWGFVGAMLAVAVGNRISAFLDRKHNPIFAANYLFFSAGGVVIGAAGILRNAQLTLWHQQAPILMLIPILYLLASLLRTERDVRGPLQWVAHTATVVILSSIVISSLEIVERVVQPIAGRQENLLAGLVFLEATAFYVLAAIIRRKQLNVYLATIAACGAVWQFMGYTSLPSSYYTLLYAILGLGLLVASRLTGLAERAIFRTTGEKSVEVTGPGASFYLSGNAVLVMAFLAAILQGLARLASNVSSWDHMLALLLTTGAGAIATALVRPGPQRWWHATGTILLAGVSFLTFNVLIDIPVWRKAEVFFAGIGLVILIASLVGRFREERESEPVSLGLWLGSIVTSVVLLITVLSYRIGSGPSFGDEIALVLVTILMLTSGVGLQLKAPTLLGGGTLGLYLAILIVELAYRPQVAIGVYLAAGGLIVFGMGVALSIYRDRLLALPDRFAKREGLFRVINWR